MCQSTIQIPEPHGTSAGLAGSPTTVCNPTPTCTPGFLTLLKCGPAAKQRARTFGFRMCVESPCPFAQARPGQTPSPSPVSAASSDPKPPTAAVSATWAILAGHHAWSTARPRVGCEPKSLRLFNEKGHQKRAVSGKRHSPHPHRNQAHKLKRDPGTDSPICSTNPKFAAAAVAAGSTVSAQGNFKAVTPATPNHRPRRRAQPPTSDVTSGVFLQASGRLRVPRDAEGSYGGVSKLGSWWEIQAFFFGHFSS